MEPEETKQPDLEKTQEFQAWVDAKLCECVRYVKLSFGEELPKEKLTMRLASLGFPDPVLQQRGHAQIWGYNYKDNEGNNIVNPATNQVMSYIVWKSLAPDLAEGNLLPNN